MAGSFAQAVPVLMHRWLACLLAIPSGSWLQLQQPVLWPALTYGAVAVTGLLFVLMAQFWRLRGASAWLWLGVACIVFAVTGGRALWFQAGALPVSLEGRDIVVEGWVAGLPREGETGVQFEWVTDRAWLDGQAVTLPKKVRLSWRTLPFGAPGATQAGVDAPAVAGGPMLQPGQRWRMTIRVQRPHGVSNPGGFDTELWLWERGIQATGTVRRGRGIDDPVLIESTWRYPVAQARHAMRGKVLAAHRSSPGAGVVLALVSGDQSVITPAQWEVFRITGVTHLVVVSGMHITFFSWLAIAAVGIAWRQIGRHHEALLLAVPIPVAAALGGAALGLAYAVFSGWGVPAQRAVFMLLVLVGLSLSGRRWPWPLLWLTVMTVVVLIDPWAMMRAGFWLSFVAVAILFATANPMEAHLKGWRHTVRRMVRTQALVTVALAPLTLMWFGQFSVVGLVANLLAIPWVTLVLTPLALAGAFFSPLWMLAVWAAEVLLWWLNGLASWPAAWVSRPATPWGLALLGAMGGVLLVARLPWSLRIWGVLLVWPVLTYTPPRPALGEYEWLAADIGQGTAVVVRTRHHTLVYDTGPPMGRQNTAADRVLLPLLRRHGEQPDMVVISHRDIDHSSGMHVLAEAFPNADWRMSFTPATGWNAPSTPCVAGEYWYWDGVRFKFLHPRASDYGTRMSTNAMSCVLKIGPPDNALLLTGDITVAEETRLVMAMPELRARVLFAAHHGSRTSTGPVWLNVLQPSVVVIQSGHRNRYGHPAPEVVSRLEARGITWVNSPTCGAAMGSSVQPDRVRCHRIAQKRYWHFQEKP